MTAIVIYESHTDLQMTVIVIYEYFITPIMAQYILKPQFREKYKSNLQSRPLMLNQLQRQPSNNLIK